MGEETQQELVRFIYEKARHHRTFHADGVWAGTTPQGEIQCTFFNDLRPLPQEQVHKVLGGGIIGEELNKVQDSQNVVREANVTVVMSQTTIKALVALFADILKKAEMHEKEQTAKKQEAQVKNG